MDTFNLKLTLLSLSTALLLSITGCSGGSSDEGISAVSQAFSGTAMDGLLVGSTVCIDVNQNNACNTGEPSAITDNQGRFSIPETTATGPLLVVGGIDNSTGTSFTGMLKAPAGSSMITPLTSAIQSLVSQGKSAQNAEADIKAALGLTDLVDVNLTSFNPLSLADANSQAVLAKQAQLQILVHAATVTVAGADASTDVNSTMNIVFDSIVANFNGATTTGVVTLDSDKITAAIKTAADKVYVDNQVARVTAKVIAQTSAESSVRDADSAQATISTGSAADAAAKMDAAITKLNTTLEAALKKAAIDAAALALENKAALDEIERLQLVQQEKETAIITAHVAQTAAEQAAIDAKAEADRILADAQATAEEQEAAYDEQLAAEVEAVKAAAEKAAADEAAALATRLAAEQEKLISIEAELREAEAAAAEAQALAEKLAAIAEQDAAEAAALAAKNAQDLEVAIAAAEQAAADAAAGIAQAQINANTQTANFFATLAAKDANATRTIANLSITLSLADANASTAQVAADAAIAAFQAAKDLYDTNSTDVNQSIVYKNEAQLQAGIALAALQNAQTIKITAELAVAANLALDAKVARIQAIVTTISKLDSNVSAQLSDVNTSVVSEALATIFTLNSAYDLGTIVTDANNSATEALSLLSEAQAAAALVTDAKATAVQAFNDVNETAALAAQTSAEAAFTTFKLKFTAAGAEKDNVLAKLVEVEAIKIAANDAANGDSSSLNPIEAGIITTELTQEMNTSINATVANIQATLEAASANGLTGSSTSRALSSGNITINEYHLADVIFTLGTDDLSSAEGNILKPNAAYDYFKTYVVDAGKLSQEDKIQFDSTSIAEFNEAFVAGYYEAGAGTIGVASDLTTRSLPLYTSPYSINSEGKITKRFFGSFFKMFNPFTYMKILISIPKTIMNAVLAQAFKVMLLSGTMTKAMLRLSLRFPILTKVMISVLSSHWGITKQMIPYLKYDKEFGELFMQLAYEQPNMAHFVFQNIDAPLYYGMSVAMTLSKQTTERLAIMMNWYAPTYFINPQPASRYNNFVRLLLNTGAPVADDGTTNHGDGNELANEKLFYSLFQYSSSTKQFIEAMEQVDTPMLGALMDHIFLGQQRNPADGSLVVDDPIQGNYNIYAIAQGMLQGIETEGFGAYTQNFIDFAIIIPADRYLPYAQKFAMAAFTYYIQNLPVDAPDEQKTMQAFMQFLMGSISQALGQVAAEYADAAQAFGQMLQTLQPYIDEFMQNGLANISQAALVQEIPDVTQITGAGIDETINDPLVQDVLNPPAPSSLIDIIDRFPLLWEKDYSNGAYKGDTLSRFNSNKVWDSMSDELSNLNWMHVPSSANFTWTSRFDFIFEEGTIDMYIVSNSLYITWNYEGYSLVDTGETVSVMNSTFNSIDNISPYKVYKVTIPAGYSLGNLHYLMQDADGIAFDISGSEPEEVVTLAEPTPPPVTDPVDKNGTVVIPVEPPVVVVPQTVDLTQVFTGLPSEWSEQDYSNGAHTSGLVYNPWKTNETWSNMPEWLSNLQWMQTATHSYFYSSDYLNFNFSSGTVDMYLVSTRSNLIGTLNINGLEAVSISTPITSTYEGMNFYVFKLTIAAGYELKKLWLMMNNVSGIAFDTSNVNPVLPLDPPVIVEPPVVVVEEPPVVVEPPIVVEEPPVVVQPPVVVVPMTQVFTGLPSEWSEQDYSNGAHTSGLVYNPWKTNETWSNMPEWLSNLQWMQTATHSYFYSSDYLNFNFSAGTVDMYLVSTRSNLPWILDMNGLETVPTSIRVTSTYDGMQFYVFKITLPAGHELKKLWLTMNNVSGIAFDTSNVIP